MSTPECCPSPQSPGATSSLALSLHQPTSLQPKRPEGPCIGRGVTLLEKESLSGLRKHTSIEPGLGQI